MKFLNRFLTSQEYDSEKESLSKPQVALVKDVRKVNYQKRILATSVELNKSTLSLSSGTSETLIATVLPTSASNKTLVWTSDNESVATVTSGGTVTAVGSNGNATITVKALYGGCSAQCTVQVEGSVVHVSSVSLNKNSLSLDQGISEALVATVLPADAYNKSVTWSTSNSSVATVDSNGVVSGISSGSAVITVTTVDGGYTAQCATEVTVPIVHVASVSLNKNNLSLGKGVSETLIAMVLPSNATNKSITWSTSNSSVATVDSNGVVSGISSGSAIITVTTVDGGYTAQCTATVTSYDPYNGHDYVEIGGLKWATMNVGANKVTDYGLYFQWGDASGYTASQITSGQKSFYWKDYKYGNGTNSPGTTGMRKYNLIDGKTVLDLEDDGVRAYWGGEWRMPTSAEWQLFNSSVNSIWTSSYQGSGVAGVICRDRTDSSKEIFLPFAGTCWYNTCEAGTWFNSWSSSLNTSNVVQAYSFTLDSQGSINAKASSNRLNGRSLRGVCDA